MIWNQGVSAGGVAHIANLGNDSVFHNCIFINNILINDGRRPINRYGDPNIVVRSQSCRFINNTAPSKGVVFLIITGTYLDDSSYYQRSDIKYAK